MWRSDSETASGRGATPSSVRGDSLHTRAHSSTNVNEYSLWRQRERREELFCDSYKGSTAPRAVSSMAKVLLAKTSSASNSSSCNLNEPKRSYFLHWLPHTQIHNRWKKQIHLTCITLLNQKGEISEWQVLCFCPDHRNSLWHLPSCAKRKRRGRESALCSCKGCLTFVNTAITKISNILCNCSYILNLW